MERTLRRHQYFNIAAVSYKISIRILQKIQEGCNALASILDVVVVGRNHNHAGQI